MTAIALGHMNPDTDSIAAAIVAADLMTRRGIETKPYAQGNPTPETQFLLDKFNAKAPEAISDLSDKDVVLVDTTDVNQLPTSIADANVLFIADHHQLGGLKTTGPVEAWIKPYGCTATILKEVYEFYGIDIPANMAGLMLGAIISDTVLFKSPTTTEADKLAAQELAKIAGISDLETFGMELLKVKSSIEGIPAKDLLFRDFKNMEMNGNKVGIGQVELVDLSMIDSVREELASEVKKVKEEGYHTVILMLTDIIKEGTELLYLTDNESVIEKAFGNNTKWLDSVLSRKKQIVPPLEKAFK